MRKLALAPLALITACTQSEPANDAAANQTSINATIVAPEPMATANAAEPEAAGPAVNLAPDELTLVLDTGSSRHIPFGTGKAETMQMIGAALGSPIEQGRSEECGAGPLDYANFREGLSLYFQDGKFAGWDVDGREKGSFSTANGIGIGTTRAALEEAAGAVKVEESSIGQEFTVGDMSGLLSEAGPGGKVTNLWAGVNCIAR